MANTIHEQRLRMGVAAWNDWRQHNPQETPDLTGLDWHGAKLSGANLASAILRGARFAGADLSGCDLQNADLSDADVEMAYLCDANCEGAIFRDTSFDSSNLAFVNFRSADLTGANLSGTTLKDTVFAGANLTRASFACTILLERYTRFCDDDFSNPANLTQANLTEARISDSDGLNGWLGLLECEGLETARFKDEKFLIMYLHGALNFLGSANGMDVAQVEAAAKRIKTLMQLFESPETASVAILRVGQAILDEIMRLKAQPSHLFEIDPFAFERIIAEILHSFGWTVELTKRTRDGGYDLFGVHKDISGIRSAWIVECKRFKPERKVGVGIVRSLYGTKMVLEQGANALLATTSHFTSEAWKYKAARYDLEYRDFEGVVDWINAYKPNPTGKILVRDGKLVLPNQ